mgnify:CR=1 FL=1
MMKIEFKDYFLNTTSYFGIVDDKYRFYVPVEYIEWLKKKPKSIKKAEKRIRELVQKFHENEEE